MGRNGFTLLELMLVMMLMVIVLGLSAPVVDSMLNPNLVVVSVDTVRSMWMEGRGRAMEEGRPYKFSIEDNGGKFKLEPDDPDDPTQETGFLREGELPTPCVFVESAEVLKGVSPPQSTGEWKTVAVFLPDGTTREDVSLTFGRPGVRAATLKLRSLTGAISQDANVRELTPWRCTFRARSASKGGFEPLLALRAPSGGAGSRSSRWSWRWSSS